MKQKLKYISLWLIFVISNQSYGQPPCFTAIDTVGCVPFTVTLTNCADPTKPDAYDYGDGSSIDFDTVHTYTTPGYYTVTQYVGNGASIDTLIKPNYIRAVGTPLPQFTVDACQGMNASISITGNNYDKYIIDYGDGSPNDTVLPLSTTNKLYSDSLQKTVTVAGIYDGAPCTNSDSKNVILYATPIQSEIHQITNVTDGISGTLEYVVSGHNYLSYQLFQRNYPSAYTILDTILFPNLDSTISFNPINTTSNSWCYQIATFDVCGNSLLSEEICHSHLDVSAVNNQNTLNWATYHGNNFDHYNLYRNGSHYATISTDTFYNDLNVSCGATYCYTIEAVLSTTNLSGDSIKSVSNDQCVTAISTDIPPEITETNSTVENNSIRLFWEAPAASVSSYEIEKSENGGPFNVLITMSQTDTNFIDPSTNVSVNDYCYKINYTDSCGNYSAQTSVLVTCPIRLTITETPTSNTLNWTMYSGFSTGIQEYLVEWLDGNGSVIASTSVGTALTFTDNNVDTSTATIRYQVRAIPNNPLNFTSTSNITESNKVLNLFFPNAFTPNNDGLNDEFKPVGSFVQEYKMMIFTRWGEMYYYTEDLEQGWNGRSPQGEVMPDGIYIYHAEVIDHNGVETTHHGTFHLLH